MKSKSTKGFTFLEVIIAMIILGLVVAGMFGLFTTAHKLIVEAGHRLQAVQQAKMAMEQLKLYVSADPNIPTNADLAFVNGDHVLGDIGLLPAPEITGVNNQAWSYFVRRPIPGWDIKEVTMRVTWTEE